MENISLQYENQIDIFNETFFKNLSQREVLAQDYTGLMVSFEWFDLIFSTIPYINNIFNDLKSFLKEEEEILKIEKVRKVGPPTFKHLAKHTNFIQEYDEEKNKIKPSYLLNTYKDDTYNTYENRFICTLVDELEIFLEDIKKQLLSHETHNDNSFTFNAKTNVDGEEITFNFLLGAKTDKSSGIEEFFQKSEMVMKNVKSWRESMLYKALKKEKAPAVSDPIKRTNVILKNPNFQMAANLWDFIHNFKIDARTLDNNRDIYNELPTVFNDKVNNTFLCFYYIMMYTCTKNDYLKSSYQKELNKLLLKDIKENIRQIAQGDDEFTKEDLVNLVSSEYDIVRKEKVADYSLIANKINSSTKDFIDKMNSSFFQIGGDGIVLNMDLNDKVDNDTDEEIIIDGENDESGEGEDNG